MSQVYLDWNATTPPHPDVVRAMHETALAAWGNPSSLHGVGRTAKAAVEGAREAVARLTGYGARDVLLTSGGTEANNLALVRPFLGTEGDVRPGTLITSRIEHPSVVAVAEQLGARGVTVVWLDVDASGRIDPDRVADALSTATPPCLVALQAVNHETGVLQPVGEVAERALRFKADLHVDAVQAVGRLSSDAWRGADSIALAAHKMRGPKGIGALVVRPGILVRPLLRGGGQERGLRPGTVDPVAAAGFGVAARRAVDGPHRYQAVGRLRDEFDQRLIELGVRVGVVPSRNGTATRAPHVTNLSWPGWAGDELAAALDLEGICVSAGSACAAGTPEPSRVITAMLGETRARSALRISLGEETTSSDVENAIAAFLRVLERHRSTS